MDAERILDIRIRTRDCFSIMFENVLSVNRLINFTAVIFLLLIARTVSKYRSYFTGINLAVVVSWTIEGLWAVSLLVRDYLDTPRI